jgi:hypothetical protein
MNTFTHTPSKKWNVTGGKGKMIPSAERDQVRSLTHAHARTHARTHAAAANNKELSIGRFDFIAIMEY